MAYPTSPTLQLPVTPYTTGELHHFKKTIRRRLILWATHLGDDVAVPAGTSIQAIGAGEVVWSHVHPGTTERHSWGGLVIIGHTHQHTNESFFSLYGHLAQVAVAAGDHVVPGQRVGDVAAHGTPESGGWQTPHLHFAIYTGPWHDKVLPGWYRPEEFRTKVAWWQDPHEYIDKYNNIQ